MKIDEYGTVIELDCSAGGDRVSPHFTAHEFCCSGDPWPVEFFGRLQRLAAILERCRGLVNQPLKITSGYRSPAVNSRTRGAAKYSQHCQGRAVDFRTWKGDNDATKRLHDWLTEHADELLIGGLGWYPAKAGRPYARIHVDIKPRMPGQPLRTWRK